MHKLLSHQDPSAAITAMVIWIEMLPEDTTADLPALVEELADPRIRWFHDPQRRAGRAIADSLGGAGQVAWDVYLFFDADAEWKEKLPKPRQWAHQLSDVWADPMRLHFGDRLEPELARLLDGILGR